MSEEEKVLLEEKGVIITNQRAIFGVKTYDINSIKSVTKIPPKENEATNNRACAMFLFGAIGLGIFFWGLVSETLVLKLLGGIFFCIAFIYYRIFEDQIKSRQYVVQISDTKGVHTAYQSHDLAVIEKIVKAINQAIVMRLTTRAPKSDTNS